MLLLKFSVCCEGQIAALNLLACAAGYRLRGLTFELRRDQRQDARPGLVIMYPCHQPGPGGLPLGLASNEGLGRTACNAPLGGCLEQWPTLKTGLSSLVTLGRSSLK